MNSHNYKMSLNKLLLIVTLSLLLMGIAAMEGCPSTTASKTGLDFVLGTGTDRLSSGDTVTLGELFYIDLNIENYDKIAKAGKIYIKDNMDDVYEGVAEDSVLFSVDAAEVFEKEAEGIFGRQTEKAEPGVTNLVFPSSGEYRYIGLRSTQPAKLIITAEYSKNSVISSSVNVPEPSSETLQLDQEPAPVSARVSKSVTKREEGYKVALDIELTKQSDAVVYSPDFKNENYIHFAAEMAPKILECVPEGSYDKNMLGKGLIELKNKKFIRCSAFVYEEEQAWPLEIKLDYGVRLKKEFPFTIKVE